MEAQFEHERQIAAFNQNHESFRSLNQQMWQIPLLAMTLTGGLWFGVSSVADSPLFQGSLLFLASAGNFALIVILQRLRFVMGEYLAWLQNFNSDGFVLAHGSKWYEKSKLVRLAFQVILGLTGTISLILLISVIWRSVWGICA